MKKLMVALTAVALGACAWAEEAVTPTLTGKVEFKDQTLGSWTPGTDWAYSGSNDDGEALKIVEAGSSKVLEIKTGTAVLTRNVAKGGGAAAIGEGIYIDTVIDFQNQALDEVPTAANDEKLAIFVLDTTEIEGAPAGTNVYVMAGYGPSGKALYRLAGFNGDITSGKHRVVVKSYANVINGGNRTGFLVYIQKGGEATFTPCNVDLSAVYPIGEDGAVTWTPVDTTNDYLGLGEGFQTTAAVARWVNILKDSACLFLSMPTSTDRMQGNLSAVDFVGNAQIASVEVTATDPGFPADFLTMTLQATGVTVGLASGVGEGVNQDVTLDGNVLTATANNVPVEVTVTLDEGMDVVTATGARKLDNGNWSFTFANGGTVSFTGSPAAAYVGETAYATLAEAVNVFKGSAGATLRLAQDTTWPAAESDLMADNLTLDLAGKVLTLAEGTALTVASSGKLTITDSGVNGKIDGAGVVGNMGALVIEKGIFDVAVVNEATMAINGGSFLKSCNSTEGEPSAFTLAGSVAQGLEVVSEGDYWKVQTKAAAQVALTIENATGATISGVEAGTVTEGSNITFTVTEATGYKNLSVSVTGAEATSVDGTYSFTVGTSPITITVTAEAINYATLTIMPVDNCTIVVKHGEVAVENGAKFDVDEKVELTVTRTPADGYVLDGYAASETITMTTDQTVKAAVKAATPTVAPGGQVTVKAETAEAAAAMVKPQATAPSGSGVDNTTYTGYFTTQATANGDGTFTVTAVLKNEIVQAADVTAEVAADLGTVAAAAGDTEVEITKAKAGLYYSVKYTADVANIATSADEGTRVMAAADGTVTITLPKVAGGKAFYQVQVNTKAQ